MVFKDAQGWWKQAKLTSVKHGPFKTRREARAATTVTLPPRPTAPASTRRLFCQFLVDHSGSMSGRQFDVARTLNTILAGLRTPTQGVEVYVAVTKFDDKTTMLRGMGKASTCEDILPTEVMARGGTALFDSVAAVVREMEYFGDKRGDVYLLNVITDGEECSSRKETAVTFASLMRRLNDSGYWTCTFQMPPYKADIFARNFGVPRENCREWEATRQGFNDVAITTQVSTQCFAASVASGASATRSFYTPVTTDLSQLKASSLRALNDLAAHCKLKSVDKEEEVKPFVERVTGRPYVVGQAYYQLMKTEKVQKHKAVLIVPKDKKAVYGGLEARELLGLPKDADARVRPGNHANYDIYVQSASTNRKLPRGTKVIIDTAQLPGVKPTWEAVTK